MFRPHIIPVLLLKGEGLVKTVKFKKPTYIGDPINAVHLFNDLKADELVFLDILATPENRLPNMELIRQIGDETYMPFAVGGNIKSLEDAAKCFNAGAEKVVLNTVCYKHPETITTIADQYGKQSVVVAIDVKKNWRGKPQVHVQCGQLNTKQDPVIYAQKLEQLGAGEIMITSIDREGTMAGYDLELIQSVADAVQIPVIACGGAGNYEHLKSAVTIGKASASAAGSLFVYHGPRKGVLINYPVKEELIALFQTEPA